MIKAPLPAPISPRTNTEVTALMAQDSTNMVMMALHNPPLLIPPHGSPNAPGVQGEPDDDHRGRRTLSESEIEEYGMPAQAIVVGPVAW